MVMNGAERYSVMWETAVWEYNDGEGFQDFTTSADPEVSNIVIQG